MLNWESDLAICVLGGGIFARHVPQEVFAGGQEWWLFTAGLCWREVYDIIKRKIRNIIEAVFF